MPVKRLVKPRQAPPYESSPFTEAEALAIKSLATGTANEGQQRTALAWIINRCAGTYDLTYFPASARDSDFAAGKRWVGQQIVGLVNMDPSLLKKVKPDG